MKRIVISIVAVFSMLMPSLGLVRGVMASSCPVKMPESLLSLYRNSESIYVAKFEGRQDGEAKEDGENYSIQAYQRHFAVSRTLKGVDVKRVSLDEQDYIFKNKQGFETIEQAESAQTISELTIDDLEDVASSELKPGDEILLFIRKDEGGTTVLTDYRDGLKRLAPADLAVYETRIKELGPIFAKEKPDAEAIVDWLVRCAEDPVTRWEGVYELERSFNALDWQNEVEEERNRKIKNGEAVDDEREFNDDGFETGETTIFAKLLNDHQKQTLANILLNSEFQNGQNSSKTRGNSELLQLVARWADHRIAAYFIDRLRSGSETPREKYELVTAISSMIEDSEINKLQRHFGRVYYQEDDEVVDDEDLIDKTDEEDVDDGEKAEAIVDAIVDANPADTARTADSSKGVVATVAAESESVEKVETTYKQLREKLIDRFLARADNCLADPMAMVRK